MITEGYWIVSFSILVTFLYTVIIIRFYSGWKRINTFLPTHKNPEIFVSIIVPFRNESQDIEKNSVALINQDYPVTHYEVIYVNDHSDDNTCLILKSKTETYKNIYLTELDDSQSGKKEALMEGVKRAKGELVLFTDADSCPVQNWVKTMVTFFLKYRPVMISGPVMIKNYDSLFSKFQTLEFMSLVGSGAGSFGNGDPVLCNGTNLGYDRKVYMNNITSIRKEITSGDDIFMMLTLKNKYPGRLQFIKSPDALVITEPAKTFTGFMHQRMRWASKALYYRDLTIVITALAVFAMNLLVAGLFILTILFKHFLLVFLSVFLIKTGIDFLLLHSVSVFFGKKKLLGLLIPAEILYTGYSVFSAVAGLSLFSRWKGRKVKYGKFGIQ